MSTGQSSSATGNSQTSSNGRKRDYPGDDYQPPRQVIAIADENTALKINKNELKLDGTLLGAGSQGRVYKAYHPAFGVVAYKELPYHKELAEKLEDMSIAKEPEKPEPVPRGFRSQAQARKAEREKKEQKKNEERELMYTNKLDNHPNILKFLAYVHDGKNDKCSGMILEYMAQGTVAHAVLTPGFLHIVRIKNWFLQLARALHYCHDIHHVIHRDVKTDNALLCDNWCTLKLCDFGFAREVQPNMTDIPKSMCCAAPETILGSNYDYKCDVYSFAMFMYTVAHQTLPFMVISEVKNKKGEIEKAWCSVKVPYKESSDHGLIASETGTTLLKNESFFRSFLQRHNDEGEDDFRPTIDLQKILMKFTNENERKYYLQQDEAHLKLMVWLMKECWKTDPHKRPTMKQVVDLLDFHFEAPLSLEEDGGKILLKNTGFYPVKFKLLPADTYEIEEGEEQTKVVKPVHAKKVSNGLLDPKATIDIGFIPLFGTRQQLKCEYTPKDTKDIAFATDWTEGLVIFVINFPIVPPVTLPNQEISS